MAGKKLLVADDSLTIQKVIRLALSNEGYEIHTVSDGNDAIQQISLFQPHVVLIDVSLPGQSAFDVKRSINEMEEMSQIRFVLMSSAFEKVDEVQAESVKFHGRLTKPFDPANLREILSQVLAQPIARKSGAETVLPKRPASIEAPGSLSMDLQGDVPSGLPTIDDQAEQLPADTDIKHLTESTIRMSGLEDYEWNVQEPSLKPQADMQDAGESSFALESEPRDPMEDSHPDLSPGTSPAAASYFGAPDNTSDALPGGAFHHPLPPKRMPEPEAQPPPRVVSDSDMESLIQQKVEETVQRLAQKLLPEVAERILKQEIHRLLSERP